MGGTMEENLQDGQSDKLKILFVEDDPQSTELFVDCFDEEYEILCAGSAEEAIDIFSRESDIGMVLSDHRMPGMTGVELLSLVYAQYPEIIRIIITGYVDAASVIEAINKGHIYQFIAKPWDIMQMRMILGQAENTWNLTRENRMLQEQVLAQNRQLSEANDQLLSSEKNLRNLSTALLNTREDEQKHIAMELHDELGQSLAALKMQFSIMENELGKEDCSIKKVKVWIGRFRGDVKDIIENVRRLSKKLSPIIIDDLGLDAGIENIVSTFTSSYGITCAFEPASLAIVKSTDGQRLVYRLVQETMNNIGKHAQATHIDFTVSLNDGIITLQLVDNGKGFDVHEVELRPAAQKGIGLSVMAERVKMLGGSMDILSSPGKGTTVCFTIPVDSDLVRSERDSDAVRNKNLIN